MLTGQLTFMIHVNENTSQLTSVRFVYFLSFRPLDSLQLYIIDKDNIMLASYCRLCYFSLEVRL